MSRIDEIQTELTKPADSMLYTDVSRLREELDSLGSEQGIEELKTKADALLEEIQHEIWVQSRTCTPEEAEILVPKIPDSIILKLSTSPAHEGKPRMLLHTPAFQKRLAEINT
ncbi:MAG: hypothetical protein WCW16_03790 [Candidatus Magasanikbacteria bacterium]|jgi:hypothetical protein